MAVNKTLSKPAAEDTLTEDMGVSETSRPIHWRFDLSSIHRTFAAAAIVSLPVAFSADRVEAATGSFLLELQDVRVVAACGDPSDPWTALLVGSFMAQSALPPDGTFALVTPCPAWTLTGEFDDSAGMTPVSFNGTSPIPVPAALPLQTGGPGMVGIMGLRRCRRAAD